MNYVVTKVTIKESFVKIVVEDDEKRIEFKISVNDYLEHPYRLNEELQQKDIDRLNHDHTYFYAYNHALRKLGYSDYSQKEMEDLLAKIKDLPANDRRQIVQSLKECGYLSDEAVSANQLYVDQNKLVGVKKTRRTLKQRGVDPQVSEPLLSEVDEQDELQRGLKKAQMISRKIHGKSHKEMLETIRQRLVSDGFENVSEIMEALDLPMDYEKEQANLELAAGKARQRYQNKYSGRQLKNAVYKYLTGKGYQSDMIEETLRQWESSDEN